MIRFRKVVFKHIVLKDYPAEMVRTDLEAHFWCEKYQQHVCMAVCAWRYHQRDTLGFTSCHNCPIRKASFRAMRVPRIILRKPHEVPSAED